MKFRKAFARFGLTAFAFCAAGVSSEAEQPFVRSYDAPDGETYSAVSLQADETSAPAQPHDHIILVDTSASQVGEHRRQTLEVIRGLLTALPPDDRVAVVAIDVQVAPLTEMVSPQEALSQALPALEKRFPAGATNLLAALRDAQTKLNGDRPGSIIYLGDGMSTARLLAPAELQSVVSELRTRRIPVHSFAVGPNKDVRLLGLLAQQTGGRLLIDDWQSDAEQGPAGFGALLAKAADAAVWYPTAIQTDLELLPASPLPLRSDRSTVYVARGAVENKSIGLTGANGESEKFVVPRAQSADGNTFLFYLWRQAEGLPQFGSPLAGENVVAYAQNSFEDQMTAMETAGYEALRNRQFAEAEQIGFTIRNMDPGNVRAVGLIDAALDQKTVLAQNDAAAGAVDPALPGVEDAPAVDPAAIDPAAVNPAPAGTPPQGGVPGLDTRTAPEIDQGFIDVARSRQEARAQKLQNQLEATMQAANQVVRVDPVQAVDMLERMRNTLKSATDIGGGARDRMLRELNSFQQFIETEAARREEELQAQQLRLRILEQQTRLIEHTNLLDQRLEQLVDRVRALLVDFREGDDNAAEEAEAVGRLIVNLRPGNPLGMAAVTVSEAAGQLRKASRLRALRADRYLETLYQVELSHVPFPDEPPVRYPPAEVWQALTERRKKWDSVDLKVNNPNEQRIYEALDKKVDLEFIDTELSQAIQYLSDRYQIPILPDETRMTEFGVGLDTQINLVISGISLRSALKLMLEQHDLTYIIEDEVMKITTVDYAQQLLQTRVYPVADLVIPIQPILGGFGGQGLSGGFNQQTQGQGQQGGLGGGGGGFNVNVGGGGGGGGIFSVPSEPRRFDNAAIQQLKKKP